MGRVEGKVAVVTGAGLGMCRAHAVLLAREGASVVVTDIDAAAAKETVASSPMPTARPGSASRMCPTSARGPTSWTRSTRRSGGSTCW